MHYLIDGYNFLFFLKENKTSSLENKRNALIHLLDEEFARLKLKGTLVFDSTQQLSGYAQSFSLEAVEIVYAPACLTADEYILEVLELHQNPALCTVVSSDQKLTRSCSLLKAHILKIEEFMAFILKKREKKEIDSTEKREKSPAYETERLLKIFEKRLKELDR